MAGRKLKVFQAPFGFYDSVVAATSQAAALRAWGTHQNLFASGEAKISTDEAAMQAALKHPETPLRRAVGSKDPFQLEPASLPKLPDAPNLPATSAKPKPKAVAPAKRPPDRTALDAVEAALQKLDEDQKREEADLQRRQNELDAAKTAAESAYVASRKATTAAIVKARQAYRKAGGEH
jgi:hypothetical protein